MDRGSCIRRFPTDHSSYKQPRLRWSTTLYVYDSYNWGAADDACLSGRNAEYLALSIKFAIDIMTDAYILGWFPQFLKP